MSEAVASAAAPVAAATTESSLESSSNTESQSAGGLPSESQIDSDPSLTKTEKVEAKKMLRSLKVKYNGREYDEALPFDIPDTPESIDYMRKQIQMAKLAQGKSQEFSKLQSDAIKFIDELKKNPRKVLSDPNIGVDLKKLAVEMIEEEIENSKKSPDQLQREKLEIELKALKEERDNEKEESKKRDFERIQGEQYERYDMLMTQALEKSNLPKSPYIVKKMADYMLMGISKGMDVTPEDVLPIVREEMHNDLKEMFAVMPEEVIEQLVGKDTLNKIRRKNLQKAKATTTPAAKPKINDVGATKETAGTGTGKNQSMRNFFGF